MDEVNMRCKSLTDNISSLVEKYIIKMKPLKKKACLLWLNSETFSLMKKRDFALKTALSGGLSSDFLIY